MPSITQNQELLKNLMELLEAHRPIFKQKRVYMSVMALLLGEILTFAHHTLTQVLMSLGLTEEDWSKGYRVFSQIRLDFEQAI